MAVSKLSIPFKYKDVIVTLSNLTWSASASGEYYAKINLDFTPNEVYSVSIGEWSGIRPTDVIIPYIANYGHAVSLMSNVNSFATPTSMVDVRIMYV